jgi:prevent-host-death family protein
MVRITASKAIESLADLLQQVEAGEEVVITREGQPVARLVGVEKPAWKPFFGPVPDDIRITLPPGEDIAPVYPDGIPWSPSDPV